MNLIPAHTDDIVLIDSDARSERTRGFAMIQAQGFRPRFAPVIRTVHEHSVKLVRDAQPEKVILAIHRHRGPSPARLARFGNEQWLGKGSPLIGGPKHPGTRANEPFVSSLLLVIVKANNERTITEKRQSRCLVTNVACDHPCRRTESLSAILRVGYGDRASDLVRAIPHLLV